MKSMEELRDKLCEELDKIAMKGDLSSGMLDTVDKLTHSIKSIDTIMAMGGYSNDDYSQGYDNRNSYARRRDGMGRYSRTSRGYSRDEHIVEKIEDMMQETNDHKVKEALRKALQAMD